MKNQMKIALRHALVDDCKDIFDWRMDSVTVSNSITGSFDYDTHKAWFAKKINDENTNIFIIINEFSEKIGMVRFDKHGKDAFVSINLNPKFRGKRLSKKSLHISIEYYLKNFNVESFVAEIKEGNEISLKIFQKVGFVYESSDKNIIKFRLRRGEFKSNLE